MKLIGCIALVFLAGGLGSLATSRSVNSAWYETLQKPALQPPDWLFGPVWTLLYVLIGAALYLLIAAKTDRQKGRAYTYFGIQLALNTLWSIVFFGLRQPGLAAIVIGLLLVFIALTIYESYRVNRTAAYLFVPYLLWVCFASYLNAGVALLN